MACQREKTFKWFSISWYNDVSDGNHSFRCLFHSSKIWSIYLFFRIFTSSESSSRPKINKKCDLLDQRVMTEPHNVQSQLHKSSQRNFRLYWRACVCLSISVLTIPREYTTRLYSPFSLCIWLWYVGDQRFMANFSSSRWLRQFIFNWPI